MRDFAENRNVAAPKVVPRLQTRSVAAVIAIVVLAVVKP